MNPGANNNLKAFGLLGNMRIVICLLQGGLCSPSAFCYILDKKEAM